MVLRSLTAVMVALFMMGAGVQGTLLLCRSQRTTHHTCCCQHSLDLPALGDELSRAPCCDAAEALSPAVPPSAGAAASFALAQPLRIELGLAAPDLLVLGHAATARPRAQAHQATGPPLHIKHRALLI